MKEIVKMVNFDHPNVMTLTGVILVEGGAPLLVMPYMVKGTLLTYVRENKDQFFVEDDSSEAADQVSYSLPLTSFVQLPFKMVIWGESSKVIRVLVGLQLSSCKTSQKGNL